MPLYSLLTNHELCLCTFSQWGLTGQDNEDLTRNILCCLEEPLEEPEPEPAENDGNIMESLTEREQIVLDVFKAQWYGREDGYQGGECVCVRLALVNRML